MSNLAINTNIYIRQNQLDDTKWEYSNDNSTYTLINDYPVTFSGSGNIFFNSNLNISSLNHYFRLGSNIVLDGQNYEIHTNNSESYVNSLFDKIGNDLSNFTIKNIIYKGTKKLKHSQGFVFKNFCNYTKCFN